ncbi:Hypothetical protein AJAP_42840 (plasmid) [Amycolatopsis japonica]|uniref:Uncharacterized protein n=1 Tax=Amycolatopsis japonica TaxID=208439 RepID=A0A075VEK4_9PSEU|nr:hypothetical protein [Amycolatopsis japonica]AIG81335.1 Hypothetical protein AJAP_42840 [Amycolatopsis japonica]
MTEGAVRRISEAQPAIFSDDKERWAEHVALARERRQGYAAACGASPISYDGYVGTLDENQWLTGWFVEYALPIFETRADAEEWGRFRTSGHTARVRRSIVVRRVIRGACVPLVVGQ